MPTLGPMTTTALVMLALKSSLALTVLGVGLRSAPGDLSFPLRRPALFARSFLAMSVVTPLLALWLSIVLDLRPPVSLALITLALSPVPPFLPDKVGRAGGDQSYIVGLLVASSLLAIVVVPISVSLLGTVFSVHAGIKPAVVAKVVGTSLLLPIAVGIVVRQLAPGFAARAARPVTLVATIVLVVAFLPVLLKAWPAIRSLIGNNTLLAIVVLTLASVAVGQLLGGPDPDDRSVLALTTAARHPAVALAIANANFPEEKLVPAALVLALLVGAFASLPYTLWSKRRSAARQAVPAMPPEPRHATGD